VAKDFGDYSLGSILGRFRSVRLDNRNIFDFSGNPIGQRWADYLHPSGCRDGSNPLKRANIAAVMPSQIAQCTWQYKTKQSEVLGKWRQSIWTENASVLSDAHSQQGVKTGEMFCVAFDKTV